MPQIVSTSVSVVALRHSGADAQVLLLERADTLAGEWCHVAGAIESGETAPVAALRELEEETGLRPTRLYSADHNEVYYDVKRDVIQIRPVFVAIVLEGRVRLNQEHSAFRWLDILGAMTLVPFGVQRVLLRHIEAEFIQRQPHPALEVALG
ncbi:MAG: NUDIX domain-containing protein [Pseudomonadota bacterium]